MPQNPQRNAGAWRALENRIRRRAQSGLVITGAIYGNCGNEKIEAPCHLYKIVRFDDGTTIAALLPNAPVPLELTTIAEVERRAGISMQSESSAGTALRP